MRKRIRVLLFLCFAAGLAMPAVAEEPRDEAPKTELQKFHRVMQDINAQLTNAGAKLNQGAVSMGGRSGNSPATHAQLCCGSNIEKVEKSLAELGRGIKSLRACYRNEQNADAEVKMNLVHQDAGSLYRALDNFNAASRGDVKDGYGAVVRGYLLLQKSTKDLTECPTTP